MSGYWRDIIVGGHKTGPHRTSIKAIEEYEKIYEDPFGINSYQTAGFKKKNGKVSAEPTMLSAKNIQNLEEIKLPEIDEHPEYDITEPYEDYDILLNYMKSIIKLGHVSTYRYQNSTIRTRNKSVALHEYVSYEQFKEKDIYKGINKNLESKNIVCRIMPVTCVDDSVKWVGIYLKSAI